MIKSGEDSQPVGDAMDNKMMPSQRRRKKVVTFASLSQLAEIRALATCESHSQSSSDSEAESVAETALPALPKPSLFLKMPLEDRDATCGNGPSQDTFLVLRQHGTRKLRYRVFRFNKERSLWLFGPLHPIRLWATSVVTNQYFELLVITVILINCVFLALKEPPEETEYVFTSIYTVEMILKIISRGFILHSYSYLRDPWNWLDFFVVLLGYITMAPNIANFTAIRAVRVLRALRTISVISGLRAMVNTLLRSLKLLSDVLVLFLFFLVVMALIGLQLFVGKLRNKCVLNHPANLTVDFADYINNESMWFTRKGEAHICGNSSFAGSCPVNYSCMANAGPNPDHGYTSFDNIGWALLMAFQILTMDQWETLYNKVTKALGVWYVFYFVITIFFCSFYLLNLVLAVVYLSYEKEMKAIEQEERQRETLRKTAASYTADSGTLTSLKPLSKPSNQAGMMEMTLNADNATGVPKVDEGDISDKCNLPGGRRKCFQHVSTNFVTCLNKFPFLKLLKKHMRSIAESALFDVVIVSVILMNTVVLALYHHGIDKSFENVLDVCNMVFTLIFVAEMIWKLLAIGPLTYVKCGWNVFDALIVIASIAGYLTTSGASFSILRSLRLFRVLNLAQSWKTMAKLVTAIARSVGPVGNITLILGVIIYIFAVIGIKVFGDAYKMDTSGEVLRWNFNDFWHAFMMVFRVLCGEWVEPLWDCMTATNPMAILFFLPAFVIGNFIVLNLFIALLLSAFEANGDYGDDSDEEGQNNSMFKRLLEKLTKTKKTRLFVATVKERYKLYEVQLLESNLSTQGSPLNTQQGGVSQSPCRDLQDGRDVVISGGKYLGRAPKRYIVEVDDCLPECCIFPECTKQHFTWLKLRCSIRCLVEHRYTEWFILFIVMFSSFVLVFEDIHLAERQRLQVALHILNYFFAVIFSLEFLLKILGLGVVTYFSSVWNCLDAFIVAISLACLKENTELSVFRSLRTLRALRPLRAISRMEGMKVVINALFAAIPGIGNVLVVSLLFWLVFSILGVQLFSGKFYACYDRDGQRLPVSIVTNKTECLSFPDKYKWKNADVNFDDVPNAFLTLFQVATFEGWIDVMLMAVDSTQVDHQPVADNNMRAYIYFVVFIILGSFFVLNLFVGVVIDNFNSLKKKYEEISSMGMLLTDSQRKWVNFLKEAAKKKPVAKGIRPKDRFRGVLYDVVTGDRFEIAILTVIMCNMVMMTIQHHGQSSRITNVLRISNLVFTGIFTAEAIVKLVALRQHYFKKAWNVFDFTIVVSSVIGVVLDEVNIKEAVVNPSLLRVMRIFRIARLLRVLEFAKGIRQLLVALMISLPALFNVGTLLLLVLFIYAIIGMSAFGRVKKEGSLDDIVNFETFGSSIMLLFRLSTGSGWNDVMISLSIQPPNCDPSYRGLPKGNCGSPLGAIAYLISYIVVVFMIIVNMYIAVILENVNRAHETDDFAIKKEDFDRYYLKWASFVSNGKQFIPLDQLSDFVDGLDKPFRLPKPNESRLRQLDIPIRAGQLIHCFDLLKALVRSILEENGESADVFKDITIRMEAEFTKSIGRRHSIAILGSTQNKFQCDQQSELV
ncbi:sodium channel protein 1 brain-like [Montipora foliosa]|uniref:sodium channel protein 1 brain-like n=1 Tax=Montipora foliosa TaxID=591990 RepID=UPI0035F14501